MKVKCPFCGYAWNTKSKMIYIVCPNCRRGIKRLKARREFKKTEAKIE